MKRLFDKKFINANWTMLAKMVNSLADTKEWKELRKKIAEANQDPEFRAALQRFIDMASNHSKQASL